MSGTLAPMHNVRLAPIAQDTPEFAGFVEEVVAVVVVGVVLGVVVTLGVV